jgi:uncharacterized protein (DUF58 family)
MLVFGVGLLLLLSHGQKFKVLRKILGPARTRLTLEGKLFLLLTAVMSAAAINTRVNLVYCVVGVMLSALIVSVLFSHSVQKIRVSRSVAGGVHAGDEVVVRLHLTNTRRRTTVFTVVAQDHVDGPVAVDVPAASALQLRAGTEQCITYRCAFPRRGVYRFTHVVLKSRFPFGLFEMQFQVAVENELVVYPALGKIRHLPRGHANHLGQMVLRVNSAGQDEFSHLRDYRPDDNPRRIHWRTSARLGELHVMEFRGLPARTAEILFDPAIRCDPDEATEDFEKAARFAATISDHLALRDYSLRFSLDGGAPLTGRGKRILPAIFESLARAQPIPYDGLAPHQGNGTPALKVRVAVHGRCSSNDHTMVAAADDPELDVWFLDRRRDG